MNAFQHFLPPFSAPTLFFIAPTRRSIATSSAPQTNWSSLQRFYFPLSLSTHDRKKRENFCHLNNVNLLPELTVDFLLSFSFFPIEQRGKTFSTIGAPKRTGKRVGLIDCASASPHSLENKRLGELVGNAVPPDGSSHLPSRSVPYLAARVWDNKSSASRSPSVVASRPKRHEFLDVRCKLN